MKRVLILLALVLSAVAVDAQTVRLERTLAPAATTLQNAVTANGNGSTVTVTGYAAVLLDVTCTTCSGGTTVTFQVSADGSTFTNHYAWQVGTQATTATSTTATGLWQLAVPSGITTVRAPVSGYSAGTITVKAYPGVLPPSPLAVNANVIGNATVVQPTAANLNATVVGTGTFATQAAQSGTWTVQPGNTANTTPWLFQVRDAAGNARGANVNASNQLSVSVDNTPAVSQSGTWNITNVSGTVSLPTGAATSANQTAAAAAKGEGATGSAVPSGAQYPGGNAITSLPTAATAGNLTGISVDKFGRQVVLPGTIRDLRACQTTTISASTSETTIVTAAGAGVFADPYLIVVSNTSASTNTRIDFRDATAGTVLFSLYSIGGVGPAGFSLPQSIPQTTANNNWTAQAATSTTDLRVYVCYEKNK